MHTQRGAKGGRERLRQRDRDREKGGNSFLLWPATSGPEACPGGWLICITPLEKTDFDFLGLGVCVHLFFSVCFGGDLISLEPIQTCVWYHSVYEFKYVILAVPGRCCFLGQFTGFLPSLRIDP